MVACIFISHINMYTKLTNTHCVIAEEEYMDNNTQNKIKELRELTGMNRKEFCDYFAIPYRTVTEWELDNRHALEYVLRLLEWRILVANTPEKNKNLIKRSYMFKALERELLKYLNIY